MNWKKLSLLSMTLGAAIFVFPACSPAGGEVKTEIMKVEVPVEEFRQQDDINRVVSVNKGDTIEVSLGSMVMGNFHWTETAEIDDEAVIKQTGYTFKELEEKTAGAPAIESWIFTAERSGKAKAFMSFEQPWRSDWKGEWTFTLVVEVR